jgi:hypothetical protein
MGLDMYMSKKTYVKQWSFNKPEDQFDIEVKKGGEPYSPIKKKRISSVVEEIGYWRKFNALHNWFVQNTQDGEDRCQESYVNGEQMEELLQTLLKVREELETAPKKKVQVKVGYSNGKELFEEIEVVENTELLDELLPPSSGFFFGGTEYDEYYKEQVVETIKLLEELKVEDPEWVGDYYYQASW